MPKTYLPEEICPEVPLRTVFANVSGVMIITFLFNLFAVWYLDNNTPNRGNYLIRYKWELLKSAGEVDWLVLGDSNGNQGLEPRIFSGRMGGKAINLCTVGTLTAFNDALMLERYVELYGPPGNILLVHAYDVWPREANALALAEIPLDWREINRKGILEKFTAKQKTLFFLGKRAPLLYERSAMAEVFQGFLGYPGFPGIKPWILSEDGFMLELDAMPENVERDYAGHLLKIEKELSLSSINLQSLKIISQISDEHKFKVYIANGPVYEKLNDDANFQGNMKRIEAELKSAVAGNERVIILEKTFPFPLEQLQNLDHVTADGAVAYTNEVADAILEANNNGN